MAPSLLYSSGNIALRSEIWVQIINIGFSSVLAQIGTTLVSFQTLVYSIGLFYNNQLSYPFGVFNRVTIETYMRVVTNLPISDETLQQIDQTQQKLDPEKRQYLLYSMSSFFTCPYHQ
jgi:hypothetical protein